MKNLLFLSAILFLLASCGGECETKTQLDAANAELATAKKELAELKSKQTGQWVLVHNVFFKTDPYLSDIKTSYFIDKLKTLSQIEYPKTVWVGKPAPSGDPRLPHDYQVALQVTFSSIEDLFKYQKDPNHLKLKEEVSKYLAGPPVVYDFWAER